MPEPWSIAADAPHGGMISAGGGAERTAASRDGAAVGSSARTALDRGSVAAPNAPLSRSCCRQA
jgi:hypothetical protein